LLFCPEYNSVRREVERLQQPYIENTEEIIGILLFNLIDFEYIKETIYEFRKLREKKKNVKLNTPKKKNVKLNTTKMRNPFERHIPRSTNRESSNCVSDFYNL